MAPEKEFQEQQLKELFFLAQRLHGLSGGNPCHLQQIQEWLKLSREHALITVIAMVKLNMAVSVEKDGEPIITVMPNKEYELELIRAEKKILKMKIEALRKREVELMKSRLKAYV